MLALIEMWDGDMADPNAMTDSIEVLGKALKAQKHIRLQHPISIANIILQWAYAVYEFLKIF